MSTILIEPGDPRIEEIDRIECEHHAVESMKLLMPTADHWMFDRASLFAARKREPVGASCAVNRRAVHSSGHRPLSVIDFQVIHDEEAPTALAAAAWFQNPASGGSATYCIDDYECLRTLPDDLIPWGAPGANYHGLHYEQAGYARYTNVIWMRHRYTIDRTAWKMARDARKYGIEVRWLDAATLKRGIRNGQTSHFQCTLAFGGDHRDPGTGYPKTYLMRRVRIHYEDLRHVKRVA